MTWEQKFAALKTLAPAWLEMRKPGDWYVNARGRYIGGDGLLTGSYGNGRSPQAAVEDDWRQLVDMLPSDRFIVVTNGGARRHFRWSGFMWTEVPR